MKIKFITLLLVLNLNSANIIQNDIDINKLISTLDLYVNFIYNAYNQKKVNNLIRKSSLSVAILLDDNIKFNNEIICACIDTIKRTNKIEPLLESWEHCKKSKLCNIPFLNEFLTFILSVYKNFIIKVLPQTSIRSIPILEILYIYNLSLNLPVGKLIDVIYIFYHRIKDIIESVDDGEQLSKTKWLEKFWYVPTAISGGIITLLIKKYLDSIVL